MSAYVQPQYAAGQTDETELYVYVEELPAWASYAANVMYESTAYWEGQVPGLQFYQVDDPALADFRVQWVKEFGVEHVGYAYGSKFIEVGLGDSNCLDQWNPFSANYVSDIMKHEIGHILGYSHVDDPNDIMYPIALNSEYGIIEHEITTTNSYGHYIPICSSKQVTSLNFHISTDDPKHGFDVYIVPDPESLDYWMDGQPFEYYAADSCIGEGFLQFGTTCEGISGDSGLLITTHDIQSNPLTTLTIQFQEVSEIRTYEISQPFPTILKDADPAGITDTYNLFVDPHGRYTIQYPSLWIADDEISNAHQASFYDEQDWSAHISVLWFEGSYAGYSGNEIIDEIVKYEKNKCNDMTYADHKIICYDFDVVSSNMIPLGSGQFGYVIVYKATHQYEDPLFAGEHSTITSVTEIHDENSIWNIVTRSDGRASELYSEMLAKSTASFKLTRSSSHSTPQVDRIPIPQEQDPVSESPTFAPSSLGTVETEYDVYEIGYAGVTYAKITGVAEDTNRGDRIAITYTYPDGTTGGNLVYPTKDGNFETLLSLDRDSPHGTYEVFASLNNKMIGIITFEVTGRSSEPDIVPPASTDDADYDNMGGQVNAPTITRDAEGDGTDTSSTHTDMAEDGTSTGIEPSTPDIGTAGESATTTTTVDAQPTAVAESTAAKAHIPEWVKISAGWWAQEALDDDAFLQAIQQTLCTIGNIGHNNKKIMPDMITCYRIMYAEI